MGIIRGERGFTPPRLRRERESMERPRQIWTAAVPSLMWMQAGRDGRAAVAAHAACELDIPGDVGRGLTMRVPWWDFAVHGIRDMASLPAGVMGNAVIVVMRKNRDALCYTMGAFAASGQSEAQLPWQEWPVVLTGSSVKSCEMVRSKLWGALGGELGGVGASTACPAAYVVEVKLREGHFDRKMPDTIIIGIIVACGRFDWTAWNEAKVVVAGCMVTFVTGRGGGERVESVEWDVDVGIPWRMAEGAFPDYVCFTRDTMVCHAPNDGTFPKCIQKWVCNTWPVVWIKSWHGDRTTNRGDGKSHRKGKGNGKDSGVRGGGEDGGTGGTGMWQPWWRT